jgi:hypothetical protein
LSHLDEADSLIARTNNRWGRSYAGGVRGSVYAEVGEVDRAIASCTESVEAGEQSFVAGQVVSRSALAGNYYWLGATEQVHALARLALTQAEAQVPFWRPQALGALALAHLLRGEVETAAGNVKTGLGLLQFDRLYGYMNLLLFAECETGLAQGNYEAIAARAAELVALLRGREMRLLVPHLLWCQGRALAGLSQIDAAREALGASVDLARAIGARHALWRALASLAQLAEQSGDSAQAAALRLEAAGVVRAVAASTADANLQASLKAVARVYMVSAE